jgi:hypothetical protein
MAAQEGTKQKDLSHLRIEKQYLAAILDSVIFHESKCSYYNCDLLFVVSLERIEDTIFVSVESQDDINIILSFPLIGYLYHRNHLLFVIGENYEDMFSVCGGRMKFNYIDYNNMQAKSVKDMNNIIYLFNDDSYSQWYYKYFNNVFILEGKSTFCK